MRGKEKNLNSDIGDVIVRFLMNFVIYITNVWKVYRVVLLKRCAQYSEWCGVHIEQSQGIRVYACFYKTWEPCVLLYRFL